MSEISFSVIARDFASRTFREVGREAWAMALKVKAANELMDKSFFKGRGEFGLWMKAIILGMPLIPPLIVATANALGGLNSILVSAIPGIGAFAAAFIANMQHIKNSQPYDDLLAAWQRFAKATQQPVMNVFTAGVRIANQLMRDAVPIVGAFGNVLTGFLQHVRTEMQSPAWDKFLHWVKTVGATNFSLFLRSVENLVVGLANLGIAFTQSGLDISHWLLDITAKFRQWSADLKGPGALGGFTSYFQATWPKLKSFVVELVTALSHLVAAFAPLSAAFLDFGTKALHAFNKIPVKVLTDLIRGFLALKVAAYAFSGAMVAVNLAMDANPIGLVIVALGALVAAFVLAYRHSKQVRDAVHSALHDIGQAAQQMKSAAKPVFDWFKSKDGAGAMKFAMASVAAGIRISAGIITSQLRTMSAIARVVGPAVATQAHVMSKAFQAAGGVIRGAVTGIRGSFTAMRTAATALRAAISAAINVIKASFNAARATVSAVVGAIQARLSSLQAKAGALKGAWQAMISMLQRTPGLGWIGSAISLIGRLAGAAGSAASAVGGLISAIGRIPSLPHLSLPHLAGGGPLLGGQVALVGEHGPELFMPDVPGRIIPADKTEAMIRHNGTPVAAGHGTDNTALLEELQAIRALLSRLPRLYLQQQRLGGAT